MFAASEDASSVCENDSVSFLVIFRKLFSRFFSSKYFFDLTSSHMFNILEFHFGVECDVNSFTPLQLNYMDEYNVDHDNKYIFLYFILMNPKDI